MRKISLLLGSLICCTIGYTQSNSAYRNLVFEGAGIRGIAYSGVIKELEQRNILSSIEKVGGTSAGAITAMMLSLGYSSDEIYKIIADTKFEKFNDGQYFFIGGIHRFKKNFGWYRTQAFSKWLENLIAAKTGNPNISFQELYEKGFKKLYITATCINKQSLVLLSAETYPLMKVKDAVRISMSVPFYFEAAFVDSVGNVYSNPKNKTNLDVMVDGGILGNFPIAIFDSSFQNNDGTTKRIANPATIGIRIDRDNQIAQDSLNPQLSPMPAKNLSEFTQGFYTLVLENLNRNTLNADDWRRTISVSDGAIGPKIKRLSADQKQRLVSNGEHATRRFLEKTPL